MLGYTTSFRAGGEVRVRGQLANRYASGGVLVQFVRYAPCTAHTRRLVARARRCDFLAGPGWDRHPAYSNPLSRPGDMTRPVARASPILCFWARRWP